MLSALHRLHHLHNQEEKMANNYFFHHPLPQYERPKFEPWSQPGYTNLYCCGVFFVLVFFFFSFNSNMNSSWFHPRTDQKLLKKKV